VKILYYIAIDLFTSTNSKMHRNLHQCFLIANNDPIALAEWKIKHRTQVDPLSSEGQCYA